MRNLCKAFTALVITTTCHLSLNAAPYTLEDFAYSATLTNATTSLREVNLPLLVYEKMQRKDYGDLRVFSANGQLVPYQLSQSGTVNSQQQKPLVFYPFTKSQAANTNNLKVFIDQKQQSTAGEQSIKITQKWGGDFSNSQRSKEYQYIIENPQTKSALCKLKLDWTQAKPSMVLPLKIESSHNLQHWSSLSRTQSVSKLNYAGSKLIQDEISVACTSEKYLRLTWLKPELQVHLQNIQGIYTNNGKAQMQWNSIAKPRLDKEGNWLFESGVVAAITTMEFIAPQDGLFYKGTLYARNNENDEWRFVKKVSQYRLNIGDTKLESGAFSIAANNSTYWKFALQSEAQFTDQQLPEIRTGWTPRKLLFLAQGNEPFHFAFGNPNIKSSEQQDLHNLLKTIRDSGSSVDNVTLGAIESSGKVFSAATNWKLITFWLMLLLGTLLMAFMAFKLFKQMGDEKASDDT